MGTDALDSVEIQLETDGYYVLDTNPAAPQQFGPYVGATGFDVDLKGSADFFSATDLNLPVTVKGGGGGDGIFGGQMNDNLHGGSGNDTIYGSDGFDLLEGEDNDDELHGGDHDDKLYGGSGDDYLFGDDHHDSLYGDSGSDSLRGGGGFDSFFAYDGEWDMLLGEDGEPAQYDDGLDWTVW